MNPAQHEFRYGDLVTHRDRPEWGVGRVVSAQWQKLNGQSAQRLTIRFEREGLKTLSTAVAALEPAPAAGSEPGSDNGVRVLGISAEPSLAERMEEIPEAARDPFRSLKARLESTLALYRYRAEGASLLDWAAVQSGMRDPMTRFNRHELEDLFRRFERNRDQHLRRLAEEARRSDPESLAQLSRAAPKAAQDAMRRGDARR